jgi:hypothetical protein
LAILPYSEWIRLIKIEKEYLDGKDKSKWKRRCYDN